MKQNKSSAPLLDLHGAREDEVFDKVDKFIHKHSQSGSEQVKIMHGKGKGIVKKKVTQNILLGLAIATVLHACFNYLILNFGNIAYSLVFLVLVGFFVLNDFEKLKVKPT